MEAKQHKTTTILEWVKFALAIKFQITCIS